MPAQVTHNNNGHFYTIDVDLAKEGAEVFDLTTYFKARVADNNVGLRFRWFWQGQVFNTVGKKPRVVGLVGQYSFKKADNGINRELVMSPDASAVAFTGDVNDCEPGGYATYYFPEQMFPQDGMFKGTVGLLDDSGETARYTSVDIWFKVYPQAGGAQMGKACDYYISELDKAIKEAEDDLLNSKKSMQKVVDEFVSKMNDLTNRLETQATTDQAALDVLEERIKRDDIVAKPQLDEFKKIVESEIDKQNSIINGLEAKWHDIEVIDYKPTRDGKAHTLSESYVSVDEAQKDYPTATSLADTKDWCALTEAIQDAQKEGRNVYAAPGQYVVNRTVTLPTYVKFYGAYQNTKISASQQMSEDSKTHPIAILESDEPNQPQLFLEDIQIVGTNDQANRLIGLHLGANRASRFVNVIVNNCFEHGTYIHATNENSQDIENPTFEHYWQVQSGSFRIESNPNIEHGNVTDFAVHDSQITSLDVRDDNKETVSQPAVEIINANGKQDKTIYGVAFERCFLHAQANNLVRIVGNNNPRATHSIDFNFIKGELHDKHGQMGAGSDPYFMFHLENCTHIMLDHSSQLAYSGASFAELINASYCDLRKIGIDHLGLTHSDSMIFTADKYSCENTINIMLMDLYHVRGDIDYKDYPIVGLDFGNAYDALDLFGRMKDEGVDNHVTSDQISQALTLNNEPHRLKEVDKNGKIVNLEEANQHGVTTSVETNTKFSKHVFAKNVTDANQMLMMPLLYRRTSGFLVSMRAIGDPEDIKKLSVLTGSNFYSVPDDQMWHVWTGVCDTKSIMKIGIQRMAKEPLGNDVTIEIEYLDSFMENKIPYYPDFVALPMPEVDKSNYEEGTILHAEEAK